MFKSIPWTEFIQKNFEKPQTGPFFNLMCDRWNQVFFSLLYNDSIVCVFIFFITGESLGRRRGFDSSHGQ